MSLWRRLLRAFDMLDAKNQPQFSKIAIVAIGAYAMTQGAWNTTLGIALLAAAFGRSTFTAFLHRTKVEVSDETKRTTEEIRKRRTPDGVEETP